MSLSAQKFVPDSLSLFDDITASNLTNTDKHGEGPTPTEGTGGWALEFINGGDWIEFQIFAAEAGQYALTAPISSSRDNGYTNVSVYPADSAFEMNGTTTYTYNGTWQSPEEYIFPFDLEAGIVYNMRVTWVDAGCNFFNEGLKVDVLEGSADATLSDLQVDGVTVADFDPATLSYSVVMQPDEWIGSITGVANDPNAEVTPPTDIEYPEEGTYSADYEISIKSESGVIMVYTVKVLAPIEIMDLLEWDLQGSFLGNNAYANNGAGLRSWGANNLNNGDYFDLYVFSAWDANYNLGLFYSNGYGEGSSKPDGMNYLNVSTLALDDTTWTVNDIYTKYLAPTYYPDGTEGKEDGVPSWDYDPSVYQYFVVSMKEYEPVLLRFYAINNTGNSANIQEMKFDEIAGSIDATLSDLTVDGSTIDGFDPMTTVYSVALPANASSVLTAATATDGDATVTGGGDVAIVDVKTADTISVVSENGYGFIDYIVNFVAPLEVEFTTSDTVALEMYSSMFENGGANVTDTKINKSYDSTYVDYYIYSATDKDVHLVALMSNGNPDTVSTEMNVSTYTYGTEWMLDDANTYTVPHSDSMMWTEEKATELEFNVSLTAGEAVMLRLFFITDGIHGSGDIYSLDILDGTAASIQSAEARDMKVYGGSASLTVELDSYLGSSVRVFDIAGRVVVNKKANSSKEVYSIDQAGIYIVQVVDANNDVRTVKCLVK